MTPVRVILAGYGAVGRSFHALVASTRKDVRIVAIARRAGTAADPAGLAVDPPFVSGRDAESLVRDVEADVLVEALPTNLKTGEPGTSLIRASLSRGLHVVVADKGPMARAYGELSQLAREKGRELRHEATVGGAIPIFHLLQRGFAGNPVRRIDGILNGTSNFILTRMLEDGLDFGPALEEARELGYAEADPTNDVDGFDAAAKLTILANSALGLDLTFDKVEREGIRGVTGSAVRLAREEGYAIRLIASVDARSGEAAVRPRLVASDSPLNVGGVENVLRVETQHGGAFAIRGAGAGGPQTATAVLSDVLALRRSE